MTRNPHQVRREILGKLIPRMKTQEGMRLRRDYSHGPEELLGMGEALVQYARDREQLTTMAYAIWPKLRIYHGGTHLRFMPTGESDGESFYVDLSQ